MSWLPDYLWGIETPSLDQALLDFVCFQTTYEELKHEVLCVVVEVNSGASRLPMRNWNLLYTLEDRIGRPSFQTTYEELKLARKLMNPESLQGFQTTYEELKLSPFDARLLRSCFQTTYEELKLPSSITFEMLLSFQTTYEELKLQEEMTNLASTTASRLPMRNWNSSYNFASSSSMASRLPMRNWNIIKVSVP